MAIKKNTIEFLPADSEGFQYVLLSEKIHRGLYKLRFHIYKVIYLCAFVCMQLGVDHIGYLGWVGS